MAQTRIKKVKLTGDNKIVLEFEKPVQEGIFDQYRVVSEEPAAPSFYHAMKALAIHVADLCELPESYAGRLTIKGVAYTFKGEEQVMGATMTAAMDLHRTKGTITLNTPHKPSKPYEINAKEPTATKRFPSLASPRFGSWSERQSCTSMACETRLHLILTAQKNQ